MKISTETPASDAALTIVRLEGDLDAASYESLIDAGRDLYASGTRRLLVDMREVGYMGSSGLVALHSVALILKGMQPPDPEYGWAAFHSLEGSVEGWSDPNVKILGPQPSVLRALERTGMTQFFQVHTDEQAALDSY